MYDRSEVSSGSASISSVLGVVGSVLFAILVVSVDTAYVNAYMKCMIYV